jgi:hypothetical protein
LALVSTRGPIYWPPLDQTAPNSGSPAQETSILLDAAAEKCAFIFRWPKSGTPHKVRFRTATVTTGDTLKVSFQDVDTTTGDPDGTPDQYRTIVIDGANDNTAHVTGILTSDGTDTGTARTVTMGERGCVVIEFDSFVAGSLNIATRNSISPLGNGAESYTDHFTAAWAKNVSAVPKLAIEYSDGSYEPIPFVCPAVSGIAAEAFNSGTLAGSGGDERGLYFQAPFACKVMGAYAFLDLDGDGDLVLYDSDGSTELASVSLDSNVRVSANPGVFHSYFDSEITLTKDTNYRLSFMPTTVTNASLMVGSYPTAAVLDALPGGQECHYTARTDAGSWSETTTKRPLMGVIVSALDDGVSTGGSSTGAINRSRLRRLA